MSWPYLTRPNLIGTHDIMPGWRYNIKVSMSEHWRNSSADEYRGRKEGRHVRLSTVGGQRPWAAVRKLPFKQLENTLSSWWFLEMFLLPFAKIINIWNYSCAAETRPLRRSQSNEVPDERNVQVVAEASSSEQSKIRMSRPARVTMSAKQNRFLSKFSLFLLLFCIILFFVISGNV